MTKRIIYLSKEAEAPDWLASAQLKDGVTVTHARSMTELRDSASQSNPMLIIAKAEQNLLEKLDQLRSTPHTNNLPLLVIQDQNGRPEASQCLDLGANKVFTAEDAPELFPIYLHNIARIYRLSHRMSSAWNINANQFCGLAEPAEPFAQQPKIALIHSKDQLKQAWQDRLKKLWPSQVSSFCATDAIKKMSSVNTAELYLVLQDKTHLTQEELAAIAQLSRNNNASTCLICPAPKSVSGLAYSLGASDVMAHDISDKELLSRLKAQVRQCRNVKKLEGMVDKSLMDARIDPLTGLYNRRAAMSLLESYHARSISENSSLTLMVIDLDHFKRINDLHGHSSGDIVLQQVAKRLASVMVDGQIAARMGGEEFLCILPKICMKRASLLASHITDSICRQTIPLSAGKQVKISLSIGIDSCNYQSIPQRPILEALESADWALLEAKNMGRARYQYSRSSA